MNLSGVMMEIGGLPPGGPIRPVGGVLPTATQGGGGAPAARAAQVRRPDPDTPTGPPPAFATTPLELDSNLEIRLARLNVAGYAIVRALEGKGAAEAKPRPDPAPQPPPAAAG